MGSLPSESVASLTEIDPGIPVPSPTVPFWQVPSHALANVASEQLASTADVVIIGSGMTGCSVAKSLLEGDSILRITVLEARGLCSGASSRNGGHIVSPSFGDFSNLVDNFDAKAAVEIADFTLNNVERTFETVDAYGSNLKEDSEIRRTEKLLGYEDQETFDNAKKLLEVWNQEMPAHRKNVVRLIGAQDAADTYGLQNVVGAAVSHGAAVWPYRLWIGIWELLYKEHRDRLAIETFTPALSVKAIHAPDEKPRYVIETPRGEIEASKVVYCTNGFSSYLLPTLRGKLFPLRGTMSVQDLGPSFPNHGGDRSWSFLSQSKADPGSDTRNAGLYYLTQNPKSGYMFLGGEHDKIENILSSDDSKVSPKAAEKIVEVLPKLFKGVDQAPEVKSLWSGIMGFSKDGIPLIGRLPEIVTGRAEGEEWIAAGFNGYGTGYCFSCGQAVAQMMLGKDVSSWVPSAFLITPERFRSTLTTSQFWKGLIGS